MIEGGGFVVVQRAAVVSCPSSTFHPGPAGNLPAPVSSPNPPGARPIDCYPAVITNLICQVDADT